jgi:hypothetical protein
MNTKSITSVAALLVAAITLNLSALAGPGPQTQPQLRKVVKEKKAVVATYKEWKAPIAEKSAAKPRTGSLAVAARGNAFGF